MAALRFLHAVYLRLAGLVLLAVAGALGGARLGVLAPGTGPGAPIWAVGIAGALGLLLLLPPLQPHGMRRPRRRADAVWILPHAAVAAVLPFVEAPLRAMPVVPDAIPALHPVIAAIVPALLMAACILRAPRGSAAREDLPDRRAPRGARTDPALPSIGAAMKLYVAADWLILRLMGLGLLGAAWLVWDFVSSGRLERAASLSHGLPPVAAMALYASLGVIMTLPILLPRVIARPRHIAGGMAKAALLVLAAFALLEPLRMAMVTRTPDIYHPTLLATVPPLFRAICGVAITSVLLVAFFRQLGTLPWKPDRRGAAPTMDEGQLREMRLARMGG